MKRTRLRSMSRKRRAGLVQRTALLLGLKDHVGHRCEFCRKRLPLDGHETRKPRARYWLNPDFIVLLCRRHHEMAEGSYQRGRLVIPGTRSTGWGMYVQIASSKFTERMR